MIKVDFKPFAILSGRFLCLSCPLTGFLPAVFGKDMTAMIKDSVSSEVYLPNTDISYWYMHFYIFLPMFAPLWLCSASLWLWRSMNTDLPGVELEMVDLFPNA